MSESVKQIWSVCLFSTTSHWSRWDVTDAGDIFRAGRSWQIVVSLPLCCVTGLIIATPTPAGISAASSALIHFCSTSLLLHFSLSWSRLTSSSCSLIHLASNPPPSLLHPLTLHFFSRSTSLYPLLLFCMFSKIGDQWELLHLSVKHCLALFPDPKKENRVNWGRWISISGAKQTANCYYSLQAITF